MYDAIPLHSPAADQSSSYISPLVVALKTIGEKKRDLFANLLQTVICLEWYEHNHYAPDCVLVLCDQRCVIQNYERLKPAKKLTVSISSYNHVLTILKVDEDKEQNQDAGSSPTSYPCGSRNRYTIYVQDVKRHPCGLRR